MAAVALGVNEIGLGSAATLGPLLIIFVILLIIDCASVV
jgi:hypothetical protein